MTATGDSEAGDFFGAVPLVIGEANLVPGEFSAQIVGEVSTEVPDPRPTVEHDYRSCTVKHLPDQHI